MPPIARLLLTSRSSAHKFGFTSQTKYTFLGLQKLILVETNRQDINFEKIKREIVRARDKHFISNVLDVNKFLCKVEGELRRKLLHIFEGNIIEKHLYFALRVVKQQYYYKRFRHNKSTTGVRKQDMNLSPAALDISLIRDGPTTQNLASSLSRVAEKRTQPMILLTPRKRVKSNHNGNSVNCPGSLKQSPSAEQGAAFQLSRNGKESVPCHHSNVSRLESGTLYRISGPEPSNYEGCTSPPWFGLSPSTSSLTAVDIYRTPSSCEAIYQSSSCSSQTPSTQSTSGIAGIYRFLDKCNPPMMQYIRRFVDYGCTSTEYLRGVSKWPSEQRHRLLLKIMQPAPGGVLPKMDIAILENQFETYFWDDT